MLGFIRRGLSVLWGESVVRRETPFFPEETRLFFLSPYRLTQELSGQLKYPYRQHVWVYACVNAIAQSISAIPLIFKTGTRKESRVLEEHPLVSLFEAPNAYMSGSQLIEATLIYLGLTGEAFYILDRDGPTEIPKEIWVFNPGRFKEVIDPNSGMITGWVYNRGNKKIPLETYEVIFFRYFNPYNDYRGMSPLQAAQAGIEQDFWASQYNKSFFQNSAQPGGVLETPGNLSDEDYQRLQAQWNDRHRGVSKAHTIAILEGGLTYKQTGLSQRDMDFLEQRRWNREEIMAAFKVPKGEIGIYEDVNYATAKTQRKLFWENTLLPKMALIEYVLWSQLLNRIEGGRIWAEFDYSQITALQEDRKELVEAARKLWSMGVPLNVINEYLDLGLPQIEGGETGYLPLNLYPVSGSASGATSESKSLSHSSPKLWTAGTPGMPAVLSFSRRKFDEEVYWKNYLALHTPLEEMMRRKMSRYFYEQRKRQLKKLEEVLGKGIIRNIAVEAMLLELEEENGLLRKLIWPLYLEVGQKAGEALMVELGADPEIFTLIDTPAMAALENKLIKVVGINDTVREQLRETLIEGMAQMETTAELMQRVKQVYNFAQSRSLTIARTEVGQAAGVARDAAMGQMGVKTIRWVTAGDENVRVSHADLNGLTVIRGQLFPNGCRFPCDPNGPAGEVINCRCVAAPVVE
ncbi:MAG: phage portal protein [Deltaproteobacteria bacterium]|nr:phage portal protein [Deltaproteobacteria bacterium]